MRQSVSTDPVAGLVVNDHAEQLAGQRPGFRSGARRQPHLDRDACSRSLGLIQRLVDQRVVGSFPLRNVVDNGVDQPPITALVQAQMDRHSGR